MRRSSSVTVIDRTLRCDAQVELRALERRCLDDDHGVGRRTADLLPVDEDVGRGRRERTVDDDRHRPDHRGEGTGGDGEERDDHHRSADHRQSPGAQAHLGDEAQKLGAVAQVLLDEPRQLLVLALRALHVFLPSVPAPQHRP